MAGAAAGVVVAGMGVREGAAAGGSPGTGGPTATTVGLAELGTGVNVKGTVTAFERTGTAFDGKPADGTIACWVGGRAFATRVGGAGTVGTSGSSLNTHGCTLTLAENEHRRRTSECHQEQEHAHTGDGGGHKSASNPNKTKQPVVMKACAIRSRLRMSLV
jgi:hypothetical protein